MSEVKQEVKITNDTGLHARPASLFVETAEEYDADIKVSLEDKEADAKSIMGIMSLGVDGNTEIMIQAEGNDAEQAVDSLVKLVEKDFNE